MTLPKPNAFTFLFFLVIAYFVYHGIWGNRGFFRLIEIQDEIESAKKLAEQTANEKSFLTQKTDALKNKNALDRDVLEEEAARVLNMIDENAVVILN